MIEKHFAILVEMSNDPKAKEPRNPYKIALKIPGFTRKKNKITDTKLYH